LADRPGPTEDYEEAVLKECRRQIQETNV